MDTNIEKVSGKKGVVIREDKYGIEVLTMRNGYQWSGMPMDAELIDMLEQAIVEFKRTQASPASVPGWKLVPDVPTSTMVLAGEKALSEHDFLRMDSAYCAMLATAPTPPVSEDRWLPIETAPKDGSYVLLAGKRREDIASGYWLQSAYAGNGAWIWPFVHKYPTHWMPLPEAPAMQEDKP